MSDIKNALWQGYCVSLTKTEVQNAFLEHFNREVSETLKTGGCWLAGPISEKEHKSKCTLMTL